jgi:hypothetical protein
MSEPLQPDILPLIVGAAYASCIQYSILVRVNVFRHCLVFLLSWRAFIECLMRSLEIIVMDERRKPLADAPLTAHPRRMEAVDSHLERMNGGILSLNQDRSVRERPR